MSVARYSVVRFTEEDGSQGFGAKERSRVIDGGHHFSAPSEARFVEADTKENLVGALRAKGASRVQKRGNQWVVTFDGGRAPQGGEGK